MRDEIKAAEQRGYSKGYVAGKKRRQRDDADRVRYRAMNAAWDRAFLAALPACIAADGWTIGENQIRSLEDRTKLAANFANEAMKHMRGSR